MRYSTRQQTNTSVYECHQLSETNTEGIQSFNANTVVCYINEETLLHLGNITRGILKNFFWRQHLHEYYHTVMDATQKNVDDGIARPSEYRYPLTDADEPGKARWVRYDASEEIGSSSDGYIDGLLNAYVARTREDVIAERNARRAELQAELASAVTQERRSEVQDDLKMQQTIDEWVDQEIFEETLRNPDSLSSEDKERQAEAIDLQSAYRRFHKLAQLQQTLSKVLYEKLGMRSYASNAGSLEQHVNKIAAVRRDGYRRSRSEDDESDVLHHFRRLVENAMGPDNTPLNADEKVAVRPMQGLRERLRSTQPKPTSAEEVDAWRQEAWELLTGLYPPHRKQEDSEKEENDEQGGGDKEAAMKDEDKHTVHETTYESWQRTVASAFFDDELDEWKAVFTALSGAIVGEYAAQDDQPSDRRDGRKRIARKVQSYEDKIIVELRKDHVLLSSWPIIDRLLVAEMDLWDYRVDLIRACVVELSIPDGEEPPTIPTWAVEGLIETCILERAALEYIYTRPFCGRATRRR